MFSSNSSGQNKHSLRRDHDFICTGGWMICRVHHLMAYCEDSAHDCLYSILLESIFEILSLSYRA